MTLACVRRPTCEASSAARKASPITYTPPWKYSTVWRGSIPSTVTSAVGTPPCAAAVTVTSAGSGCADTSSLSSRRCSSTLLPTGRADWRRIASRVACCSMLTRVSFGWIGFGHRRIVPGPAGRSHPPSPWSLTPVAGCPAIPSTRQPPDEEATVTDEQHHPGGEPDPAWSPPELKRILYTAEALVEGGRAGHGRTSDGRLEVDLSVPAAMSGDDGPGTNPEQLFAVGYAACFQSALLAIAQGRSIDASGSQIASRVGIGPRSTGGFGLQVWLDLRAPEIPAEQARELMLRADQRCPYSNAATSPSRCPSTENRCEQARCSGAHSGSVSRGRMPTSAVSTDRRAKRSLSGACP